MSFHDLYKAEGAALLNKLAAATGANRKYLYQCAVGIKTPSPDLARRLGIADARLTFDAIYARPTVASTQQAGAS